MHQKLTTTRTRPSADIPWYFQINDVWNELPGLKSNILQLQQQGIVQVEASYPSPVQLIYEIDIFDTEQFFTITGKDASLSILGERLFITDGEQVYNTSVGITVEQTIENL